MILQQIVGVGLILLGFGISFVIPDIVEYQAQGFAKSSIVIGIFLIILGAYLLLV